MPEFVSAYQGSDGNTLITVTKEYAEARGLTTLKSDDPLDSLGRPRGARPGNRTTAASSAAGSTTTTTGGKSASRSSEEGSTS